MIDVNSKNVTKRFVGKQFVPCSTIITIGEPGVELSLSTIESVSGNGYKQIETYLQNQVQIDNY